MDKIAVLIPCYNEEKTIFEDMYINNFPGRTRAFVKIQDGCNYYCTYWTIPIARGRSRNGSIESLVNQAREVAENGGKEIVITGVNIGDFGHSTNESFFDLIRELEKVDGIERYRISSIEPNLLTDEIIDHVAQSKVFMPHFHIPLQSGSDDVLRLMRRKYDTELFAHKIEKIKSYIYLQEFINNLKFKISILWW